MFKFRTPSFIIAITNWGNERNLETALDKLTGTYISGYRIDYETDEDIIDMWVEDNRYKVFRVSYYLKSKTYHAFGDDIDTIMKTIKSKIEKLNYLTYKIK